MSVYTVNSFLLLGYDRGMYKLYNVHVRSKDLKQNSTQDFNKT